MLILILGVLLWSISQMLPRLMPSLAQKMGKKMRPVLGVVTLFGLVLMIWGYKTAEGPVYWGASGIMMQINNMAMLAAIYLFVCGIMQTSLTADLRNASLWGVVVFAAAHILVNGDLPSFVLFGGMALWALLHMALINRDWEERVALGNVPKKIEVIAVFITFGLFLTMVGVHALFGYSVMG